MDTQIKVFHFSPKEDDSGMLRTHVANIRIDSQYENEGTTQIALEYAYGSTQNIDGSWSQGPFFADGTSNDDYRDFIDVVAPLEMYEGKVYGHRSSMTGDEFEFNGEVYRVANYGFKKKAA